AISSAASITVNRIPEANRLAQNFPNPFNARTVVPFDLPAGGKVHLSIYNIAGQRVRTLVNGWREAGFRSVIWDGRDRGGREVASGVYLVRLEGSDFTEAKRMVLLRIASFHQQFTVWTEGGEISCRSHLQNVSSDEIVSDFFKWLRYEESSTLKGGSQRQRQRKGG
ncbi:MAG: T9SS type A sorting domain-containing protein, partial [Candidatus Latescibacteria bacterium]|nr:T9SS type A sorting domain-containing protein [Candidatus Latescibacterota bacterium]